MEKPTLTSADDWIANPTPDALFSAQTTAKGGRQDTARALLVGTGGELWVIPVGRTSEVLFSDNCPAGVVSVFCDGIGASSAATEITALF